MKEIINTKNAPTAVGPYNQAVAYEDLIFTAGQIPLDPRTGLLVETSFTDRVRQVMANLKAILTTAGSDLTKVIKVTVYLTDMEQFRELNKIYSAYFTDERAPARSTIQVAALPLGTDIEIEMIAHR